MRKCLPVLLTVVLAGALVIGGCNPETPVTPAEPSPAAAPVATPAQAITLKVADTNPRTAQTVQGFTLPWMQWMEEATDGQVKFELYDGGALCKGKESWEAVQNGIADISPVVSLSYPGMIPLSNVLSLPLIGYNTSEHGSIIAWKLYEQFPSIREEYKGNKLLHFCASTPYFLITTKEQVKTMEDLKGLKIRIGGGPPTDYLKAAGASPLMVSMPDTYTNLQKGVMDGMAISSGALSTFRQYEVAKYFTYVPLYSPFSFTAINWDVWNSLPSDVQAAMMNYNGFEGSALHGRLTYDVSAKETRDKILEQGYEMVEYTIPDDELARWKEAAKPIWDKWVKDMEAKGHPEAQDILDTTVEMVNAYQGIPYEEIK